MSDDREESVTEGQKSIYFDATEGSQLLPGRPLDSAAFPDIEASPWTISPPPVLPAPMGGLRSMGGAGGGMATSPLPHSEAETTTLRDDESLTASTLDDSYMGHVRAQATLPKKWLSEVDIEPYMRGTGGRGGKKSIFAGRGLALRDPLLEELLPSSRKAALFPALQGPVPRRDWIFATAYWIALAIMMVLGLALCLVHPVEMKDRVIRSGSMFRALVDSVWILFAAVVLGSLLSTLWVVTLRKFPTHVVHGMVYAAPMAAFVVGLTAAYEYLRGGGGGWWLFLTAIAGLVLSGALATWSLTNRHHIANTVAVVKMSAEVLAANPSIYLASLALLVGYVVFVALWIVFYAHALMLGHVSTLPDAAAKVWRLSGWSYYLQAYMILMLVWTSTICAGLQKCMIGGVVGKWYFFRTQVAEAVIPSPSSHSWDALRASLTTHFGQICLASLVLTGVRISRGFFQAYRYVVSKLGGHRIASSMLRGATLFFGFLERLLEHLSDLSLYFVALTGESFWSSSRAVFKIFRRNMLLGFTADSIAQLMFAVATGAAAILTGLFSYGFISQSLASPHGMVGAVLFTFVTWYALRFFTSIFSNTYRAALFAILMMGACRMDAMFVCFAIDLDTKKLHCPAAHQVFTHRIASEGDI